MKLKIRALLLAAMFVVSLLPAMSFASSTVVAVDSSNIQTKLDEIITNDVDGDYVVELAAGTYGDFTVEQVEGINITILGNGSDTIVTGTITIDGNSRHDGAETLTFDGIVFQSSEASHNFIYQDTADGAVRYPHNVTVQNCDFSATDVSLEVCGIRIRQGYNIKVLNCTASGLHTLMQATSCSDGLLVDNVVVENCTSGVCVKNSYDEVTVSNSVIKTVGPGGFGVRVAGNSQNDPSKPIVIEACEIEAFVPVLLRQATSGEHTLEINGECDMTAKNDDGLWCVVTKTDFNQNTADIVAPDASVNVILNETGLEVDGIFGVNEEDIDETPLVRPAYAGPVMNWVKVNTADNGVVKSGPLAASAGATVTLYPKAAAGYVLDTVEVLDAEGNAVELDGLKFAIPAGGVTVNATFKLAE